MKKLAAETLIEALTAMTVFGIVIGGVADFMANQTIALARAKNRDNMLYYAQVIVNQSSDIIQSVTEEKTIADTGISYRFDGRTLILNKDKETMHIEIK